MVLLCQRATWPFNGVGQNANIRLCEKDIAKRSKVIIVDRLKLTEQYSPKEVRLHGSHNRRRLPEGNRQ